MKQSKKSAGLKKMLRYLEESEDEVKPGEKVIFAPSRKGIVIKKRPHTDANFRIADESEVDSDGNFTDDRKKKSSTSQSCKSNDGQPKKRTRKEDHKSKLMRLQKEGVKLTAEQEATLQKKRDRDTRRRQKLAVLKQLDEADLDKKIAQLQTEIKMAKEANKQKIGLQQQQLMSLAKGLLPVVKDYTGLSSSADEIKLVSEHVKRTRGNLP